MLLFCVLLRALWLSLSVRDSDSEPEVVATGFVAFLVGDVKGMLGW